MRTRKLPILLSAILWLCLNMLPTAQAQLSVVVGGNCPTIGGPITCTENGTHDGKPKFTGTNSNNQDVTVQWDNTPPRWFILFDDASYFQSSITTNLPPSGGCAWTIGPDLPQSWVDEACFNSFSVTGSGTVTTNCSWDGDGDGLSVNSDNCNNVANPDQADNDFDNVGNVCDNCPNTPNFYQEDSDSDGTGDACDGCPNDPNKTAPGDCGCGVADTDTDNDGTADCIDGCPNDPNKTAPGACGCGVPDPNPGTISGTTTVCSGNTTQLSSNGTPNGTWNSSNTTVATVNASSGLVGAMSNGTTTISYTVTNGSCSSSASTVVTVNTSPVVTCPASSTVCSSTAPFALSGGSPTGGTYSGPGVSNGVFSPSVAGAGTHNITYTVTQNGCSGSCTFTITVNVAPTAGTITAPGFTQGSHGWQVCFGSTMQMVSSGTPGGTWTVNNPGLGLISITPSGGLVTPLSVNPFVTDSMTIFYRVTVAGCPMASSLSMVEVRGSNPGTISGNASVCNGSSTQYTTNGQGGGTWMSSNTAVAMVSSTGLVSGIGSGTSTISYTVTSEGCSNSATKVITVNTTPPPTITGPTSVCSGSTATLDAGAGYNAYAWSNSGGSGQTATFSNLTSATTFTVTVTNGNSCTSSGSKTVNISICDTDNDGIPDVTDNCPTVSNTNQSDLDGDGIGDACDDCQAIPDIPNFNTENCNCDPGYFPVTNGETSVITACQLCPPGYYCPDGEVAIPCPAGSFSNNSGQIVCESCPAGTFSSTVASTECANCPAGTFNGSTGQTTCVDCPAGSFSSTEGSLTCASCPAGTFGSNSGQVACESCPPGSFSSTMGNIACASCPAGTFSSNFGQIACESCPPGSFSSTVGNIACESCPANTYNPSSGQTECLACPAGTSSGPGSLVCVEDADGDCDGIPDSEDNCPGGDDNGPCDATSFPGFPNIPSYWICGNRNNKVLMCHDGSTICVNQNAVAAHLGHGDFLGPCVTCPENRSGAPVKGNVALYPNPANSEVWIDLSAYEGSACMVRIFNLNGAIVYESHTEAYLDILRVDVSTMTSGMYFVYVQQDGQAPEVLKLTVVNNN